MTAPSGRRPVRVGVIGAGRIGRMHAELVAHRVEGLALAAVADVVPGRAEEVGASLGAPALAVAELVGDPAVDAVAICSSTGTHVELILQACAAGKAVFCEKPVSLDLAEVDRALAAVQASGVPFMVGFNRRFDPAHQAVHDAVARGDVGPPHLVRITSRDPAPPPMAYVEGSGGIFLDMTVHDFDMARYVTGSEVTEVYAAGAVRIDPGFAAYGDLDTAVVTLRHQSGCLTVIDNSRQAVYGYDQRVEVFGPGGLAASDNPVTSTHVLRTAEGAFGPGLPHFFIERYAASYIREWEAFVAAVATGAPCPVSGADGRAPLVIGLAAGCSVREHRPVGTDEIKTIDRIEK